MIDKFRLANVSSPRGYQGTFKFVYFLIQSYMNRRGHLFVACLTIPIPSHQQVELRTTTMTSAKRGSVLKNKCFLKSKNSEMTGFLSLTPPLCALQENFIHVTRTTT
jgi:hypothetical protein